MTSVAERVMVGGGEMGQLMRSVAWEHTAVGPVSEWPQSLRTALSILLASGYPMYIAWGPEFIQFYNDAYRPILGTVKHPAALGRGTRETWAEIWDIIGPMFEGAMRDGETSTRTNQLFIMHRNGYPEECYFDFSYSPIRAETGEVGGVLTTCSETTGRILSERRLRTLRDLAARTGEAREEAAACDAAIAVLAENPADVPFALLYLLEDNGQSVRLAGVAGLEPDGPLTPVRAAASATPWNFTGVLQTGVSYVHDLTRLDPALGPLPGGPWPEPSPAALVLPIAAPGQEHPAGVLVAGVSPRRALDPDYRSFYDLVASQISKAVADARAYEAERQRAEALAELDRAKTAFFSNVSHEFRTPLTLLLGPAEDALETEQDPRQRERLQLVHRNALRLMKLVNTLLDFARIEAGRIQAVYQPVDLPAFTAELASSFRSAVERAGLRLTVDCPPLPPEVAVYADRDMWEKVVLNLLSNAFKFTFEGEIAVTVRPSSDRRSVEVAVRDTGAGIPAHELPRLFERFHRVQGSRARSQEGSGIGLALVQELVRLHGGTVAVQSVPGRGSTFTVTLPAGMAHLPAERIAASQELASTALGARPYVEEALRWLPSPPEPAAGAASGLAAAADWLEQRPETSGRLDVAGQHPRSVWGRKVLVVDDNADMREYLQRLLAPYYDVTAVPDADAALAAAAAAPPDLVLSDVMLPGLDGFGLLQQLRADPQTALVPVILLSARAGEEAKVEGLNAGADDYLVKPFSARELLARVEAHLQLAELRNEASRREQAARAQLEELLRQAPAAIALLRGPDHVFTLANLKYLELLGGRPILGKTIREALPEVEGQGYFELLDRVYATGEPFIGNEMHALIDRRGDGALDTVYFNFSYAPLRRADGSVEGVFVLAHDVTPQVRARAAVEQAAAALQSRARQQAGVAQLGQRALAGVPTQTLMDEAVTLVAAMLELDHCAVLELHPEQDVFTWRAGTGWQTGIVGGAAISGGPDSLAGYTLLSSQPVVVDDLAADTRFRPARVLRQHQLVSGMSCMISGREHPFGVLAAFATTARAFSEEDVHFLQAVANVLATAVRRQQSDVERTELLRREQAMRRAAEEAVRAREEFLSIASHELRNPVAGIKGSAQLLRRSLERGTLDDDRLRRYLDAMEVSSLRLATLTDDLLDVSRLQRGAITLQRAETDLAELVRSVAREQRQRHRGHRFRLDVPSAACIAAVDPVRIEQIAVNLIENAAKYTPAGE